MSASGDGAPTRADREAAERDGYVVEAGRRLDGPAALWRRRGLLGSLVLREIGVRYRQAALGVAWALLQPLALVVVTTLVFHRFLSVDAGPGRTYPLFVYIGLFPWTFFHGAVTYAVPSLVNDADLVRKIWFPREALPLASVGVALLDLGIGLSLGLVWCLASGLAPRVAWLWLPPLLLLLLAFAASLGLLGAAVNVFFRDVKHALPLVLQVLFFATPVVFPWRAVPVPWSGILAWNPLTAVVTGLRRSLLEGLPPDLSILARGTATAVLLLAVSYLVFKSVDRRFADVV